MNIGQRCRGADDPYSMGLLAGSAEVGISHTIMKCLVLLFVSIRRAHSRRPGMPERVGDIEQTRQTSLQPVPYPLLETPNALPWPTASAPLIGVCRVSETIAKHPLSGSERREDHLVQMLVAGAEHQERFGFR